jgi:hypothetical protein
MAIIKETTNVRKDAGQKETLIYCWWECNLVQLLQKSIWRLVKKLKLELSCDLTISLLDA